MRYGRISATFLAIAGLAFICTVILPSGSGWGGNPLAALGGLLIVLSIPAAVLFGIIGIANDRPRTLAIATTAISGGFVLLWIFMIGAFTLRR